MQNRINVTGVIIDDNCCICGGSILGGGRLQVVHSRHTGEPSVCCSGLWRLCRDAVDRRGVEGGDVIANDFRPPRRGGRVNCLDEMLAEKIRVIFLCTTVTREAVHICDVRATDRNPKKAFPGMLEGLIEMRKVWCTALGSVIGEDTFEGHAVSRESIRRNDVNNLIDAWAVVVPEGEPLDITPECFDHHGCTLAWYCRRVS